MPALPQHSHDDAVMHGAKGTTASNLNATFESMPTSNSNSDFRQVLVTKVEIPSPQNPNGYSGARRTLTVTRVMFSMIIGIWIANSGG